jgi:DEAD/DEAH box helicase domain-containing protein
LLPSVVASELEQVVADAIRTACHPTTPGFRGLIDRFLRQRLAQVACLAHEKPALIR